MMIFDSDLTSGGSISLEEFGDACTSLHNIFDSCELAHFVSRLHKQDEIVSISIHKTVNLGREAGRLSQEVETENAEVEEYDESAIIRSSDPIEGLSVEYSIFYHQTYRVPVLYFDFHKSHGHILRELEAVYRCLVPPDARTQLKQVGVLGGISVANHPLTDLPSFYIHPCNTAAAMEDIVDSRPLSSLRYLQTWIGMIGASVGLDLPIELAVEIEKQKL